MEGGSAPLSPLNGPQTHKLSTRWVLWFDYPSKGEFCLSGLFFGSSHAAIPGQSKKRVVWESNLRKIATMETLEDFWAVLNKVAPPSKMAASCNYHLFREGIEPRWEDKANEQGGKVRRCSVRERVLTCEQWVLTLRREKTHASWMATCVAAIAEQLESELFSEQVRAVCACLWRSCASGVRHRRERPQEPGPTVVVVAVRHGQRGHRHGHWNAVEAGPARQRQTWLPGAKTTSCGGVWLTWLADAWRRA